MLVTLAAQVGQTVAAIGQHDREITHNATGIVAATPGPQTRHPSPITLVMPSPSAASASSPAPTWLTICSSPSDVTSTANWRPSRITFKVILLSLFGRRREPAESLLRRTVQRPRPGGAALLHARSGLEPSGTPAWKTIPSWYVVPGADNAIGTKVEMIMAHRIHAHIIVVPHASHVVMISHPAAVTKVIVAAAKARG